MKRTFLLLLQLILIFEIANAQLPTNYRFPFPDNARNSEIQSPARFLGYALGDRFTEYAESVAYFEYLARESDRINLEEYGRTYERRPLLLLTISSAANIQNIDAIKEHQQSLVDRTAGRARSRVQRNDREAGGVRPHPVINSYSYNIHGNEASSTEAAMQFAYELATTKDPELVDALTKTVNLLFVCINPDGRTRYVTWYNTAARRTGGASPSDFEHHAPWPNGRTNHYWFDLNRDWIWGIHPESRGHTRAYQEWMPQVHTDYHEQGYDANYFTVPGTTPRNLLLPERYETWADTFGRANAAEFDKRGISYFTREAFDFYYPSYGSSYPSVMGSIGMLTEQGGIAAGRAVETEDGYVLTLRQRIFDHYTTSVAQVRAAAHNRQALIDYSLEAWDPLSSKVPTTAYVLEDDGNEYLEDVVQMLLLNGVEVERTKEDFRAPGIAYRDGLRESRTYPAGSIIVSTEQARHLFVNSILGREMPIEDSVMYDMSTWSAPLAYNLAAYELTDAVRVGTEPVTYVAREGGVAGDRRQRPTYAYVVDWTQRSAPKYLAKLWEAGYRVRSAQASFTVADGTTFPAGSLIVLAGRNPEKTGPPRFPDVSRNRWGNKVTSDSAYADFPKVTRLDNPTQLDVDLSRLAKQHDVVIHRYTTGRVREGYDLASTSNFPVKPPKVALLVEPPFNTYTAGQLYWLFDYETELPVDRIRVSNLRQTDLPRFGSRYGYADLFDYDVLILPEARNLGEVFGQDGQAHLRNFLNRGGTIVALGSSAEFLTSSSGFLQGQPVNSVSSGEDGAADTLRYAERTDYYGKQRIPGTALRGTIDTSHPLAFGVPEEVFTLKFGNRSLAPNRGLQSVGRYLSSADGLLSAGYASRRNLDGLAGNTFAGVRPVGQGRIVYFMDNPHYRMFWRGPSRMMVNAVMVVPGM